jgi:hypothetical protein
MSGTRGISATKTLEGYAMTGDDYLPEFRSSVKRYLKEIADELRRMNKLKGLELGLRLENGTSERNWLDEIMED